MHITSEGVSLNLSLLRYGKHSGGTNSLYIKTYITYIIICRKKIIYSINNAS